MSVSIIPDTIRGSFIPVLPPEAKLYGTSWLATRIGKLLCNTLFLPLHGHVDDYLQSTHKEVSRRVQALQDSQIPTTKNYQKIRTHFQMRDVQVVLEDPVDNSTRSFIVRLFETTQPIKGKSLRVFLFSFYGNTWDPQTITQLSRGPLDVLAALHKQGIKVDSIMSHSLGNCVWHGLDSFLSEHKDRTIIPQTILIDRGITSIEKVGKKLYSCIPRTILSFLTRWTEWSADPEQALCSFVESAPQDEKRIVHIYQAETDHYFSGPGDFDPNHHTRLARKAEVVRLSFTPVDLHPTAHHGAPINQLQFNSTTKVIADTDPAFGEDHQKLPSVIARKILLGNERDDHTLFIVGGNKGTLDMMVEEIGSRLLTAFIKEANNR